MVCLAPKRKDDDPYRAVQSPNMNVKRTASFVGLRFSFLTLDPATRSDASSPLRFDHFLLLLCGHLLGGNVLQQRLEASSHDKEKYFDLVWTRCFDRMDEPALTSPQNDASKSGNVGLLYL